MQVWNVLHAARWKYRTPKNRQKFAIWAPSHNLSGCIFATKACIDNQKNSLNSNISSTFPHNMRSVYQFVTPQQISTDFGSFLRYCSDVAHQRPTKHCTMFGRLLQWYTIHCRGLLSTDGILPGAKFTLRPSLGFSYIDSVTARHAFAAWYKEWNYGTFAEGATHIRLGGHHVGHRPTF